MCLKAISHPYNFINLIPSIIYVQVLTLKSLLILTLCKIIPLTLPTQAWMGIIIMMTARMSMPGHPNRMIKMARIPANPRGATMEAKKMGDLVSMVLKSFDNKLIIFPSSCDFAVYCDILESLV